LPQGSDCTDCAYWRTACPNPLRHDRRCPGPTDLPNVDPTLFDGPTGARFHGVGRSTHAPRFLPLYGSLRERSFSKLLTLEAARLLQAMGAQTRVFDPTGLPLPDGAPDTHPKVVELRGAAAYYERVVDVMEELVKFTLLTRDVAPYLVDRYSERRESAAELSKRVNQLAAPMIGRRRTRA